MAEDIKKTQFEKQIKGRYPEADYEWLVEFSKEFIDEILVGFDIELTTGTRWGNHTYISLASLFLSRNETPLDLIPGIQDAIGELTDLVDALGNIRDELLNLTKEIESESS